MPSMAPQTLDLLLKAHECDVSLQRRPDVSLPAQLLSWSHDLLARRFRAVDGRVTMCIT
jgi:hypothetical protein